MPWRSRCERWRQRRPGGGRADLLVWLLLLAWLVSIQRTGEQLVGPDYLLVPGIAQQLVETPWIGNGFAPTEPGRVYPPAMSIWFSPWTLLLRGPEQLALWTFVTQAAQAAFPLLWAAALKRWFPIPIDRLTFALILAASTLCPERSVVLGGAVKNAQFVSLGVVLPTVLLLLPRSLGWRQASVCLLLIIGLVAAYYTLLQLIVALVVGWVVGELWMRRRITPRLVRQTAVVAASALIVGLFLAWAFTGLGDDPRLPDPSQDLTRRLRRILIHPRETFWFIFGFSDPEVIGGGLRRFGLLLASTLCLALPSLVRLLPGTPARLMFGLQAVARVVLGTAVASLTIAVMVILAPVTRLGIDFGRWLLWPAEAIVLAGPFLALAVASRTFGATKAKTRVFTVGLILLVGAIPHLRDARIIRDRATQNGTPLRSVRLLSEQLRGSAPCVVVAASDSVLNDLFQVGWHPLSDTVDVVSPCRLGGGSFSARSDAWRARAWGPSRRPDAAGLEERPHALGTRKRRDRPRTPVSAAGVVLGPGAAVRGRCSAVAGRSWPA